LDGVMDVELLVVMFDGCLFVVIKMLLWGDVYEVFCDVVWWLLFGWLMSCVVVLICVGCLLVLLVMDVSGLLDGWVVVCDYGLVMFYGW